MQRIAFSTLFTCLAVATASAAPLNLDPYAQPVEASQQGTPVAAAPAPAPQRYAAADGPNLGGGFLELLFRPPGGQYAAPPPQYRPEPAMAPQPEPMALPAYRQPQPYGVEPDADNFESVQPSRRAVNPRFMRQEVNYDGHEKAGTVIINTKERLLYLVKENGRALRYGIGVGRPGFTWAGTHHITSKREWPDWTPPPEMIKRQPHLPRHMAGGPDNPLGARAMYLGSTLYRIHGSNEPWTIGHAVSSGCIRLRNEDVIDLYGKVKVGTKVVVI